MNRLTKIFLLSIVLGLFFLPIKSFAQTTISLDHVDGTFDGKIAADTPIKFHVRWVNNYGSKISAFSIGYRIFLRNNIELPAGNFDPVAITPLPGFFDGFDFIYAAYEFSDGVGADTVGVQANVLVGSGIPNGFDDLVYEITTSVSSDFVGDTLCLDSSFFPVVGNWKWFHGSNSVIPDWSGPHCYEIAASCCVGLRGNFNNSPDDLIDISDLVQLNLYMFGGGNPPACFDEANFDGLGGVDISDLVLLVSYMFQGGLSPASCF